MAKLSTSSRSKLPKSDFTGPGRSFPVENHAHAEAAIFDVPRAVKAGHLTAAEGRHITAEAKRKLK